MAAEPPGPQRGGGGAGEPGRPVPTEYGYDLADDDTQPLGRAAVADLDDAPADLEPPAVDIDPEELAGLQGETGQAVVRRVLPLEDEASPLVARYLFPTERFRGEWKRHGIHLAWPVLVGVLATFALGWLAGLLAQWSTVGWVAFILVLLWLAVMVYVAWRVADWHFDRFILTNKRIMKIEGIVTRNVAMMPLLRVTDMKYVQSPMGRVLNYGTFVIESAGQEQALREVPFLPNPNELYLRVVEEMYEPAAVEARLGHESGESEDEEERVGDS